MKWQDKIIKLALANFDKPDSKKKHFSFIMDRNKVISFGYNRGMKTHPIAKKFGHKFSCQHSELHAIIEFPHVISELQKYTMVNVRLLGDKSIALSKPCKFCGKMLKTFHIKKLYYSNNNGEFLEYLL